MSIKSLLLSILMPILPKRLISRCFGRFAAWKAPWPLRIFILRFFVWMYRLNMAEAERPLDRYSCLDDLFTRRLRPGLRPIQSEWIHPVDGVVSANGRIENNTAFQIKGWNYDLTSLLGENRLDFDGGAFITYYLCPTDYHRVHVPLGGKVISLRHLQGQLWPVNEWSVNRIRNLFCKNERVVVHIHTTRGPMAVVLVGATNVGQIEIVFEPSLRTNLAKSKAGLVKTYNPPIPVLTGAELGAFHMGSTVVVLASAECAAGFKELSSPVVRVGQPVL